MKKRISIVLVLALVLTNFTTLKVVAFEEKDFDINVLEEDYYDIEQFVDGYSVVVKDKKYGVINEDGKEVVPCQYDYMYYNTDGLFLANKGGKDNGVELEGGKWGYVNTNAKEVIAFEYDFALPFDENGLSYVEKNGKKNFIDKNGNSIIKKEYDDIAIRFNVLNLLEVVKKGKKGFVNLHGKEVLAPKYDDIIDFRGHNLFKVKIDEKEGLLKINDDKVQVLAECQYDFIRVFDENVISLAELDKETLYIDENGKKLDLKAQKIVDELMSENKYSVASYFSDNLISVMANGASIKIGLVDYNKNEVLPCRYDQIYTFNKDYKIIYKDHKIAFLDNNGTFKTDFIYDEGSAKHLNKKIILSKNASYGVLDENFNEIIPFEFDDVYYALDSNSNLLAFIVAKNSKFGLYSLDGKKLTEIVYDNINTFFDDYSFVIKDNKVGFIDKNGDEVIKTKYIGATLAFKNGILAVKEDINSKWKILKLKNDPNKKMADKTDSNSVKATYSKQNITVNGKLIKDLEVYNIADHNYFKLRDIAKLANGKEKQFAVNWNGKKNLIAIKTGEAYTAVGTELKAGDETDKLGVQSSAKLEINGNTVELNAYTIQDQNYYEIRPLGKALNFGVEWNDATQTVELEM